MLFIFVSGEAMVYPAGLRPWAKILLPPIEKNFRLTKRKNGAKAERRCFTVVNFLVFRRRT